MAFRPSDSTPKFDNIREAGDSGVLSGEPVESSPANARPEDVPAESSEHLASSDEAVDAHVEDPPLGDDAPTEAMFPRQNAGEVSTAADEEVDDVTVKLATAGAASPSGAADVAASPTDAPAQTSAPVHIPVAPAASTAPAAPVRKSNGLLLVLLISYASAVTLALIYLLATRGESTRHQLENLRDPIEEEGTVRIQLRSAEMPPGHTLALSESRRFGNILVEPLKVTQGPLEFVHYTGDPKNRLPASPPVLKLWLRLTNVSKDQEIAPLDALLMYKRAMNESGELVANSFVTRVEDKADGPLVFTYPVAQNSEWDLKGQELGTLQPGESVETFIPSDAQGLDDLSGRLVWRVHFRKGYAATGRGVTTLVEVVFDRDDVVPEDAASSGAAVG